MKLSELAQAVQEMMKMPNGPDLKVLAQNAFDSGNTELAQAALSLSEADAKRHPAVNDTPTKWV